MHRPPDTEPIADATMEAKMRQLWAHFSRDEAVLDRMRAVLPPCRARALECDFILHPRNNYTEYVLWRDGHLPEEAATDRIRQRLAGQDVTLVDVGANVGAFSLPILKAASDGARAILFEPNPEMVARLETNIALNALSDRTEIRVRGVSDATGEAKMYFPSYGNLGQGRIGATYDTGQEHGLTVELRPLPNCLADAKIDRIDVLKVDVEGHEDRVIGPLLTSDAAPKPDMIYFEVAHDAHWVYPLRALLANRGYVQTADFEANALFERRST